MKTIRVAAAVIFDNSSRQIFAAARGYGDQKGGWEFPGGKIEPGETSRQALIREIREELDIAISAGELLGTVEYDYPAFHLSMDCFACTITQGQILLREAAEARWLSAETLDSVNWLPADRLILPAIRERLLRQ